jgi:uncharacterized protein with PIN domain
MRLVADKMLAKLARWIRLGGHKIEDAITNSDDSLIKYARTRHAVLLTQDEALANRARRQHFRVLLVKGNGIEEQLAFVAKNLGLRLSTKPSGICPYCNARLIRVDKSKIKLPEKVARRYRVFYKCPECGRVYWHGSHWKKIESRLKEAKRIEKSL